jgi:hypothetical protein
MLQMLQSTLAWLGLKAGTGDGCDDGDVDAVLRFEQFVGDVHLAALQCAVVTSGINVLTRGGQLTNASDLKDLMPTVLPASRTMLPRQAREVIGLKVASLAPAREFLTSIKTAQRDLENFCADVDSFGTEEAAFLDVAHIDVAWHNLSTAALAAVVAMEPDVERCLAERYTRNTPVLKKLLLDVIKRGHPCVDDEGTVKLPDLPQRRTSMRPNVHMPCVLEYHGKTYPAVVKDISTGGIGLERAPTLMAQNVVVMEFENGSCLSGMVVWSKGDRAGVKLDVPLKSTHPLLDTAHATAD